MVNTPEPFDPESAVSPIIPALRKLAESQARLITEVGGVAQISQRIASSFSTRAAAEAVSDAARIQDQAVSSMTGVFAQLVDAHSKQILGSAEVVTRVEDALRTIGQSAWLQFGGANALAEQIAQSFAPVIREIQESLSHTDWALLAEKLASLHPSNWSTEIDLEKAMEVINESGIPLIWVPRSEIVEVIVAESTDEGRCEVLLKNSALILKDIHACVSGVSPVPKLRDQVLLIQQAAAAFEAGHSHSAQALATVAFDSLVLSFIGRHNQVELQLQPVTEEVLAAEFVRVAALSPILVAFSRYQPQNGDPIPTRYNRHATVHSGSAIQFTQVNALIALMLAASTLRTCADFETTESVAT